MYTTQVLRSGFYCYRTVAPEERPDGYVLMYMNRFFTVIRSIDWPLFVVTLLLLSFGLATLFSLTLEHDPAMVERFHKQLISALIGIVLMIALAILDYRYFRDSAYVLFFFTVALLVVVLLYGKTIRGTTGWLDIGILSIQPVEFAKVFVVLVLSRFLAHSVDQLVSIKRLIGFLILAVVPSVLVLLQPDFGSAFVLMATVGGYIFFVKTKKKMIIAVVLLAVLSIVVAWFFVFQDFQRNRVFTFFDPARDPLGTGYHVSQAVIAVGSGKLWGRGLGLGPQSQLKFLPAQETDFIFAVIAEQLGFVGTVLVLGLFAFLLFRLLRISVTTHDPFGSLFCLGLALIIVWHMVINIAMNMGMAPVTGLPLPLMSYGRSSLLSLLIGLGIAQSIAVRRRKQQPEDLMIA